VPAAAVIPAPIAYIKVVVVKKLVVGSRRSWVGLNAFTTGLFDRVFCQRWAGSLNRVFAHADRFTLKKLECSKQASPLEYSCME
jgi:hypothetical protein